MPPILPAHEKAPPENAGRGEMQLAARSHNGLGVSAGYFQHRTKTAATIVATTSTTNIVPPMMYVMDTASPPKRPPHAFAP